MNARFQQELVQLPKTSDANALPLSMEEGREREKIGRETLARLSPLRDNPFPIDEVFWKSGKKGAMEAPRKFFPAHGSLFS